MRGVRSWTLVVHGLSFLFTTWAYVWFLWYAGLENAPLFRSLHAVEKPYSGGATHVPRSYFTLDWVMHPAVSPGQDGIVEMLVPMGSFTCQANGPNYDKKKTSCAPEWWQRSSACPFGGDVTAAELKNRVIGNSSATSDQADAIVKQFYNPTDETNNENMILGSNSKLTWPVPTMKDSCRIERIGEYSIVQNDVNSWSLGGAHSSDLLVAGAAVTLWLVNAFAIINLWYVFPLNEDSRAHYADRVRVFKFVLAFLALLAPIIVRVASTPSKTVNNATWHNTMPNGSYFYVLLAAFWAATISFYTPSFSNEQHDAEDVPTAEPMQKQQEAEVRGEPLMASARRVTGSAQGLELDTSSFYSKKKLSVDAYMARSAPLAKGEPTLRSYDPGFTFTEYCFVFQNTSIAQDYNVNFEMAQLFTFPLLLLAVHTHYSNYAIDAQTQMLFLAALGYALLDVFARRVVVGGRVYDELCTRAAKEPADGPMSQLQTVIYEEMQKLRVTLQQCCACHAVRVCHVLSIALQLLLAVIIFFCMRWQLALGSFGERRTNALVDGWRREMVLDYSGFAFVAYVLLSAVIKLIYSFWHHKFEKPAYGKVILLALFLFYVVTNVAIIAESHHDRVNGIFEFQNYRIKAFSESDELKMLVGHFSAGWELAGM